MTDGASTTIDPAEVARFERIAETWWDPKGPMKVLHKFNPVRLAYIRDEACRRFGRDPRSARSLDGLTILDVGCGGGVLSEPLARLGATVTGLDPAPTNISVARLHAERAGLARRLPQRDRGGGGRPRARPSTWCSPWRWWSTWPTCRPS